jgi:hypothetical protein
VRRFTRSLARGARRLRGKAEDLGLALAVFGGAAAIVAGAWTVARAFGLVTLGLLLIAGAVLRVAGTSSGGES